MFEPTLATGFARALIDLAVAKGAAREALMGRAGTLPEDLADPDRRLPLASYKALMREAKAMTGEPALALHFGEAFDISELSIVGLMGQASPSFEDAFARLGRYSRLMLDVELEEEAKGDRLVMRPDSRGLWIVDMRKHPNNFPEITESAFARMAATARRFAPGASLLHAVHFTHEEPNYRAEYDRIFQVPLVFGSDRNAVLLANDSWQRLKGPAPSRYVFDILRERAEALLQALDAEASLRSRVETLLAPVLHSGEARMAAVAQKLGLSRATLFRRLREEGTSFEALRDDLRHRLALHYLVEKKARVSETAWLLGFADPASFSRACKRWTGKGPRALRG
jgi:AraC-like DNA-binding protein